jgi:hypothetical protein
MFLITGKDILMNSTPSSCTCLVLRYFDDGPVIGSGQRRIAPDSEKKENEQE